MNQSETIPETDVEPTEPEPKEQEPIEPTEPEPPEPPKPPEQEPIIEEPKLRKVLHLVQCDKCNRKMTERDIKI